MGQVRQGKGHSTRSLSRRVPLIKLLHSSHHSTTPTVRVRATLSPQNSPSGHHRSIPHKTNDLSLPLSPSPQTSQVLAKPHNSDTKHNPSFFLFPLTPLLPFNRNLHPEENPRFTPGVLHPSLYHTRFVQVCIMRACDHPKKKSERKKMWAQI